MNRIVAAWKRYQARPKYDGPDDIDIDEETKFQFPLEEKDNAEEEEEAQH
jgi:hypothetical protein